MGFPPAQPKIMKQALCIFIDAPSLLLVKYADVYGYFFN
jgi:hypothetical protein